MAPKRPHSPDPMALSAARSAVSSSSAASPAQDRSVASSSNSQWPTGYPFKAREDSTLPDVVRRAAAYMRKGDIGKIMDREDRTGSRWVKIQIINRKVDPPQRSQGWVPFDFVDVGTRQYGNTTVEAPPTRSFAIGSHGKNHSGTQLHTGILALLKELRRGYENYGLTFIPEYLEQVAEKIGLDRYASILCDGVAKVHPNLLKELNSPKFTLNSLKPFLMPVKPGPFTDERKGIYVIVYHAFKNAPNRPPEIIIGQTRNFGACKDAHNRTTESTTSYQRSYHYTAARAAKDDCRFLVPICLLDHQPDRDLAEQLFILLLETYVPNVLATPPSSDTEGDARAFAKLQFDMKAATFLVRIKDAAKQQSHWPGACHRMLTTMGGVTTNEFGSSRGLNWKTPFLEQSFSRKDSYTRLQVNTPDGIVANFRRCPHIIKEFRNNQRTTKFIFGIRNADGGLVAFTLPSSPTGSIDTGDEVHVLFELLLEADKDGKARRHPYAYARLPQIGCFDDWAVANTLAVCIEKRMPDGTWIARYLYSETPLAMIDRDGPGSNATYASVMGVIRWLRQKPLHRTERRAWDQDLGTAHIKQVTFDHMPQTFKLVDRKPSGKVEEKSKRITHAQLAQMLTDEGAENAGSVPGTITLQSGRKSCDTCYLAGHVLEDGTLSPSGQGVGSVKPCKQTDYGQNCQRCEQLGRPCSFTSTDKLMSENAAGRKLRAAVYIQGLPSSNVEMKISDPRLQGPGQNEILWQPDEEDEPLE